MADDVLAAFRAKFRLAELEILANGSWTWSVRPAQPTLGSGVLSLRRYDAAFGGVTAAEGQDLAAIVRTVETALARAFRPDRMNYLMLMMVDRHVHFHVVPRYDRPVAAAGAVWRDPAWPGPPALSEDQSQGNMERLQAIRALLRDAARG